jgi:hypothetical protein
VATYNSWDQQPYQDKGFDVENYFNKDWDGSNYDPGSLTGFADLAENLMSNWGNRIGSSDRYADVIGRPALSAAYRDRMQGRLGNLQTEFLLQKALGTAAFQNEDDWDTRLGETFQQGFTGRNGAADVGRWGSGQRALQGLWNQINSGTKTSATESLLADKAGQKTAVFNAILGSTSPLLRAGMQNRLESAWSAWNQGVNDNADAMDFVRYAKANKLF